MVAGDIPVMVLKYFALGMAEPIPYGKTLAIIKRTAFYLI
jgi:hypothetical protein